MQIYLPNSAFLGNIDPFLMGFDASNPDELIITANKKWISLHPMALTMIAALGLQKNPARIRCEKFEAKSRHYFERMGLFKFFGIDSRVEIREHEPAGRFVPLTQIKTSDELTRFISDVTPLFHLEPIHAEPLRYILSELVRNVLEHSGCRDGAVVAAQYYKKSNTIRIGISDTGVGVWRTIRQSHKPKDDLDALRLALTPGITGTTTREGGTEQNAGAGLFFIKSIATVNNDFFAIYSGTALYKLLKRKSKKIALHADPFEDRHSKRNDLPFWQGTAVGIDLSLDETQEFSFMLKLLNKTYREAIKERKRLRYKNPQFI